MIITGISTGNNNTNASEAINRSMILLSNIYMIRDAGYKIQDSCIQDAVYPVQI